MAAQAQAKPKKSGFKVPHMLFLLFGMMVLMTALTYVLPAGEFVDGVYTRVEQNPVNPGQMLMYIYTGLVNSATVIAVLLASGGAIGVTMGTGALDRVIDGCVYKLRDKGISVLVPIMFLLMALLGAFGGGDSLIAVVPIGVMFAQKLRLDPISGASISLLGTLTGFACRPGGSYTAQSIMGITLYSGYNLRLVFLLVTAVVGALYVTWYAKRIEKDPSKSAMGDLSWQADLNSSLEMEEKHITGRDLLITALFIAQFPVAITLNLSLGLGNAVMPAVLIPVAIICGLINGLKTDQIGKLFEKGVANMGFIAFIIGFAGAISLIMQEGKILDTIAYYACMPLESLSKGFAAIGISAVVWVLDIFVPSASAKVAAMMPLIKPIATHLGLEGQVAVQAFLIGDGFGNIISPFLGWTMGGLAVAKVPYNKWLKWCLPYLALMLALHWALLYYLATIGWTGM